MFTRVAADFLEIWAGGCNFIRLLIKGNAWDSAAFGLCCSPLTGDILFFSVSIGLPTRADEQSLEWDCRDLFLSSATYNSGEVI